MSVFLISLVLLVTSPAQGQTFALEVEITSNTPGGSYMVAVFDNKESFLDVPVAHQYVTEKSIRFELEKGDYSISVFQDLNGNKELDSNLFGVPTEPYGFSNNARGSFGPPSFQACLLKLDKDLQINIDLN